MADCNCGFCAIDETGAHYDTAPDNLGNECVQIPRNPIRKANTYDSSVGETPADDCCEDDWHLGSVAVDTADPDNPCVTHICAGPELGWLPICGMSTTPDPGPMVCCYDLTTWNFPVRYGNANDVWIINGQNVLAGIQCPTGPTPSTPSMVEFTCDFTTGNSVPNHPAWETLGWTDTGQAAGSTISATGNPADGWACTRPTFRIDFGTGPGTGPYSFDTEITDGSGVIGFGMYDECNGVYLPITGFTTTPTGGSGPISAAFINPTNLGDTLALFTQNNAGQPWTGFVHIDYADPNNVDASCLRMVITSMGNYAGTDLDDLEQIVDSQITFTPDPDAVGTCCLTASSPADIAALLNGTTTLSDIWVVQGNQVCTTVPTGAAHAAYGQLSLPCDGVSATPTTGGGSPPPPDDDPCVIEWCVLDGNGNPTTVTLTEQPDGTYTPSGAPATITGVC